MAFLAPTVRPRRAIPSQGTAALFLKALAPTLATSSVSSKNWIILSFNLSLLCCLFESCLPETCQRALLNFVAAGITEPARSSSKYSPK